MKYTVKAIGNKLYRNKTFETAEEAHKYTVNLMNWYNKVRTTTETATIRYTKANGFIEEIRF